MNKVIIYIKYTRVSQFGKQNILYIKVYFMNFKKMLVNLRSYERNLNEQCETGIHHRETKLITSPINICEYLCSIK